MGTATIEPGYRYPRANPAPNTVVVIGDSLTENGYVETSTQKFLASRGYYNWANILLNQRLNIINYAGVAGETTAEILARFHTDVIAYKPAKTFIMAGVNDVIGSIAVATTKANLQAMYELASDNGIAVVTFTVTPRTTNSTARNSATFQINAWLKEYALSDDNMTLIDAHGALVDPTSVTAVPTTGLYYDATHMGPLGARIVGQLVYDALVNTVPAATLPTASIIDNYGFDSGITNIFDHSLMNGTAGTTGLGASGTVADGLDVTCTGSATAVASLNAAANGIGQSQDLAITATASGEKVVLSVLSAEALHSRLTSEDTVWIETDIDVSGANIDSISGLYLTLLVNGTYQMISLSFSGTETQLDSALTGRLRTAKFKLPAVAYTAVVASLTVAFNAAGTVTVKASDLVIRREAA